MLKQWQGVCVICQDNEQDFGLLCAGCHHDLGQGEPFLLDDFINPNHERNECMVVPAFAYAGVINRAMRTFKDDDNPVALPILIHAIAVLADKINDKLTAGELPKETVILPVPTTKARLREKGIYIVGALADYLSAMTGLPIYAGVVRVADGQRQRGLTRDERQINIKNAFAVESLPNANAVIIFDDVITTGATVGEIANTLWQQDDTLIIMAMCIAHGN